MLYRPHSLYGFCTDKMWTLAISARSLWVILPNEETAALYPQWKINDWGQWEFF